MKKEEEEKPVNRDLKVGQTIETVYGDEVDIVDILPNTVVVDQYDEGLIILYKSDIVRIVKTK